MEKRLHQWRKKNLINYLNVQEDIGWGPHKCQLCKFEKDELDQNGNVPCWSDKCKYFGNMQDVQKGDLRSNLVGIEKFLELATGIVNLCPLDPQGYVSVPPSEIQAYGRTVDVDEDRFFELMETYVFFRNKLESDRRKRENGRT